MLAESDILEQNRVPVGCGHRVHHMARQEVELQCGAEESNGWEVQVHGVCLLQPGGM